MSINKFHCNVHKQVFMPSVSFHHVLKFNEFPEVVLRSIV